MNGRRAGERRRAQRRRVDAVVSDASMSAPRLLRTFGTHEIWAAGRALFVLPRLDDDDPPELKTAIDRRRRATLSGVCECGARRHFNGGRLEFEHVQGCCASDAAIVRIGEEFGQQFRRLDGRSA